MEPDMEIWQQRSEREATTLVVDAAQPTMTSTGDGNVRIELIGFTGSSYFVEITQPEAQRIAALAASEPPEASLWDDFQ
jgi:hypothetical protein